MYFSMVDLGKTQHFSVAAAAGCQKCNIGGRVGCQKRNIGGSGGMSKTLLVGRERCQLTGSGDPEVRWGNFIVGVR